MASCLDDENEIPLKVIASFSATRFALSIFAICAYRYGSLFNLGSSSGVGVSFTEVISSIYHVQYLSWYGFLMESLTSSRDVV